MKKLIFLMQDYSSETLKAIKAAFIAELGYSIEETAKILENTKTTLKESDNIEDFNAFIDSLKRTGAQYEIEDSLIIPPTAKNNQDELELIFEFSEAGEQKSETPVTNKTDLATSAPSEQTDETIFEFFFEGEDSVPPTTNEKEVVIEKPAKQPEPGEELSFSFSKEESPEKVIENIKKELPAKNSSIETNSETKEESFSFDEDIANSDQKSNNQTEAKSLKEENTIDMSLEQEPSSIGSTKANSEIDSKKQETSESVNSLKSQAYDSFSINSTSIIGQNISEKTKGPLSKRILNLCKEKNIPIHYIVPIFAGSLVIYLSSLFLLPEAHKIEMSNTQTEENNVKADKTTNKEKFFKLYGESLANQAILKATFTANIEKLNSVNLEYQMPKEELQKPEEIIFHKKSKPWISKVTVDKIFFTTGKEENIYIAKSQARVYIEHEGNKFRAAALVIGRAKYEPKDKLIKFAVLMKYNIDDIPQGADYLLNEKSTGEYEFFTRHSLEAKIVEEEEK